MVGYSLFIDWVQPIEEKFLLIHLWKISLIYCQKFFVNELDKSFRK